MNMRSPAKLFAAPPFSRRSVLNCGRLLPLSTLRGHAATGPAAQRAARFQPWAEAAQAADALGADAKQPANPELTRCGIISVASGSITSERLSKMNTEPFSRSMVSSLMNAMCGIDHSAAPSGRTASSVRSTQGIAQSAQPWAGFLWLFKPRGSVSGLKTN